MSREIKVFKSMPTKEDAFSKMEKFLLLRGYSSSIL